MRLLLLLCCFLAVADALIVPEPPFRPRSTAAALPPAALRDVAAEATAAASLLTSSRHAVGTSATVRPLVLMAIREDDAYAQLVAELVQHVTSGNRAGSSWVRPLALRRAENATLAAAAERFDPVLGWLDEDVGGGSVHLFSAAPPAAFLPTIHVTDAPAALAVAVRSLSEAHAAASTASEPLGPDAATQQRDMGHLQAFMRLVTEHAAPADEDTGDSGKGGGLTLYDPFANL